MPQSNAEALIARWMEDATFRERMRAAPVETAAEEGYELSEEEQRALAAMDLSASDEALARQASFGG